MDISIIIVNYNTLQLTRDCIDSIREHTSGVEYEIILVDNASTDGSLEYFSQRKDISYIYNEANYGFGKANNIGYTRASGKYLFILNSDTRLLNNALLFFFEAMEHAPYNVAGCGTILLNEDLSNGPSYFRLPTLRNEWMKTFHRHSNIAWVNYPAETNEVEAIIGADYFIRRSVADQYGLFNTRYFLYSEDDDINRRYRSHGYINLLIEGPRIIHYGGSSIKNQAQQFTRSHWYYLRQWNSTPRYLLFLMAYIPIHALGLIISRRISWAQKKDFLRMMRPSILFPRKEKPTFD